VTSTLRKEDWPPLVIGHATLLYSLAFSVDHRNQQPTPARPSARSNFANKAAGHVVPLHPLSIQSKFYLSLKIKWESRTDIEGVPSEASGFSSYSGVKDAYFPCTNVLILNPNVGLTDSTSSLFSFFTIVVLPALSSPLNAIKTSSRDAKDNDVQEQYSHLTLLSPVLPDHREQAHSVLLFETSEKGPIIN
jgi:hypothetical protein